MVHKFSKGLSKVFTAFTAGMLLVSSAFADVINIRSDAPQTYVVKKGDTLWDISSLFLDKPWLWPELWRNNTQIENPHLIYPGDILRLRFENGVPVLEVVKDKTNLILTPDVSFRSKPAPIDLLPWKDIGPFIGTDQIMAVEDYDNLPTVYGDRTGTPRFIQTDFLLTESLTDGIEEYDIVRRQRVVKDSMGKTIGLQVDTIGTAKLRLSTSNGNQVIEVTQSDSEARQGDKIVPRKTRSMNDLVLQAADRQRGELVENANGNKLIGRRDIVIINIGERHVSPGTVLGIYEKGVDIYIDENPVYADQTSTLANIVTFKDKVEQPAYKVGELVVVSTFEEGSYAFVTKTTTHLKGGEIVAAP